MRRPRRLKSTPLPWDPAFDEPKYLLGDLAAATGMTQNVLKAWLTREPRVIRLGPYDKPARGKGSAREFTLRTIIHAAVVAELVRLGVAPTKARLLVSMLIDVKSEPNLLWDWQDENLVFLAFPNVDAFIVAAPSITIAEALEGPPSDLAQSVSFVAVSYGAILRRVREQLTARGKLDQGGKQ